MPLTLLVVATAVVAIACRNALRERVTAVAGLPAALVGVATVALVGTVLNDSGVVVGGFAVIMALTVLAGAGLLTAAADGPPPEQAG